MVSVCFGGELLLLQYTGLHLLLRQQLMCTSRLIVVGVQYPSIKSLRSTIVERSFYGASVFAERRSRTVSVPFRLSSVPFRFHSVLLANQRDQCEVSVNASFGSEDDLQLLQMVAEGSRYESASFCVAARAYSDPESRLINYARTQQRAKQRKMLGLGHN